MSTPQNSFPRSLSDITPEWLTSVLRADGLDVTVGSIVKSGLGEGVGMMSGLQRLAVSYSRGDGPAQLILKMPSGNDANRAVAEGFNLYERELRFYRDVAPRSGAYTPKVYAAEIEGHEFILLLEDLSAYQLGDQVKGCTLDETRSGITWLARHHASLWGKTDDPSVEFLPYVSPSYSSEGLTQGCAFGWDPMVAMFGDVVPPHIAEMKDRYLAALPKLFEWMATPPLTVVHGDFRMDNLFFGHAPGQEPLIAVDWQGALRGRATQDIAYFLTGSVPTEVRRANERKLIDAWHDGLLANGVTGYSKDDAWEDYRKAVLYVWVIAVVIAGTLDASNERGRQWISAMLARSVATMDDLNVAALLDELV
jgi:hypothetical protein